VALAVITQAAGGVRRIGEGYRIRPAPECRQQLSCYCQYMSGLRGLITEALANADWPYRDDGAPSAIGTSIFYGDTVVGGSIQPYEDVGLIRIIAFGSADAPVNSRPKLYELCGKLNSGLLNVTFEIDAVLKVPVCRTTAHIESVHELTGQKVLALLGTVTANYVAYLPAFIAVNELDCEVDDALQALQQNYSSTY